MKRRPSLILCLAALAASCSGTYSPAPHVAVTVDVDFGPAGRGGYSRQALVPAGSTPADALADVSELEQGFVCCTKLDVWSVDGVATDADQSRYWIWKLNGKKARLASDRYTLENGDTIAWVYRETEPHQHDRR